MQRDQRAMNGMASEGGAVSSEMIGEEARGEMLGAECVGRQNGCSLRPHSTPATLLWLDANYEMAEGVCIPRSTLYEHYVHFCSENCLQPVNAASFGKIIRQQFPLLTTRRLGTRGQSRYHYYGIATRETSSYFEISYSRKGGLCNSDARRDTFRQTGLTQRYKLTTLLPEFPNIGDVCVPPGVSEERVASFLIMYKTHCQRIFETIMRASIEEVQNFLLHFWQGMPPHLLGILGTPVVVNMVGVCDSILYRAICSVLMPAVLQSVTDNLLQVIQSYALEQEVWLHLALEDFPLPLRNVKLNLAHNFSKMLKRQSSLGHLCQAAQMVILNADLTSQMLHDLKQIDLESICRQTLYTMEKPDGSFIAELITELFHEFQQLLEGQATIETYAEWLESIVDRCVLQPANNNISGVTPGLKRLARRFLLVWTSFGTRVIRDMTLHSAPSFGSFHLLHLMFDDYVLHLVDIIQSEEKTKEMLHHVNYNTTPDLDSNWGISGSNNDGMLSGAPMSDCQPSLPPDYAQLQPVPVDSQDMTDMAHHGAIPGEYPTPAEPFPAAYPYDTDYRNEYKNPLRHYVQQNYNQTAAESQNLHVSGNASGKPEAEKSFKFMNTSLPHSSPEDCNNGISLQCSDSQRTDGMELSSNTGLYCPSDIETLPSGNYYNYVPNPANQINRY